jgi:uncharacterized GH25 family protein
MLSANLIEFCKVLTVVFGTSMMIFSIKKVVVGFDSDRETDKKKDTQNAEVIPLRTNPDIIDYDGMGNQGRFPTRKKS